MKEPGGIEIRLLSDSDIPAAMMLKEFAGWNQTEDDWRCLLRLEPQGCFAAFLDGDLVGTTTTTTYGNELAWIGMVLVHPARRRKGIATTLLSTAFDYLKAKVATVKLDATPEGQLVYERFGFQVESFLERWSGVATMRLPVPRDAEVLISLSEELRAELLNLDRRAFCADRSRFIEMLIKRACVGPVVVRAGDNKITGYTLVRRGSKATYVGPVVLSDPEQGASLLDAVLGQLKGQQIYIDLNVASRDGAALMSDRGFKKQRDLIRMRFGRQTEKTSASVFAIAGPEVG